jgi:hypothetical protein
MKHVRFPILVVLTLIATLIAAPMHALAKSSHSNELKNIPVSGVLADGTTFIGKLTIESVGYDAVEGLVISGELKGNAGGQHVKQDFANIPVTLADGSAPAEGIQAQATCDILLLDVGPIFLDLLGLQLDLSQIVLDLDAVSGAGNLLGNLLCGVVGLLDPLTGLIQFVENLNQLLDLLNQINQLI